MKKKKFLLSPKSDKQIMSDKSLIHGLPQRLVNGRVFGRKDKEDPDNSKKLIEGPDFIDDDILINETHIPKSSLYTNEAIDNSALPPASPNVLTIIGILPNQLKQIQKFFKSLDVACLFDRETVEGDLGNWVVVTLNKNVEEIPELSAHTQFADNVFGGCYVGRYREESIFAIPADDANKNHRIPIFRHQKRAEDLTTAPLEDKSLWIKIREFVFGENEIRVKDTQ